MTSDQFVDEDGGAAQAAPASPASWLPASPASAAGQARPDQDSELLSDREVIRLFTTGRRPISVRMWVRRLRRTTRD